MICPDCGQPYPVEIKRGGYRARCDSCWVKNNKTNPVVSRKKLNDPIGICSICGDTFTQTPGRGTKRKICRKPACEVERQRRYWNSYNSKRAEHRRRVWESLNPQNEEKQNVEG